MDNKTPVSLLQEHCAKNKKDLPKYTWRTALHDISFVCTVQALGTSTFALGSSKRDAKQEAAAKMLKMILQLPNNAEPDKLPEKLVSEDLEAQQKTKEADETKKTAEVKPVQQNSDIQNKMDVDENSPAAELRRYCEKHNLPQPKFDVCLEWFVLDSIVFKSSTPHVSQFVVSCQVNNTTYFGTSTTELDATYKAAHEMLCHYGVGDHKFEKRVQASTNPLRQSSLKLNAATLAAGEAFYDRHNYFAKFDENLKKKALEVLDSDYATPKEKADALFRALKLKPKIATMSTVKHGEKMILVELKSGNEAVFVGFESEVYQNVFVYFREML